MREVGRPVLAGSASLRARYTMNLVSNQNLKSGRKPWLIQCDSKADTFMGGVLVNLGYIHHATAKRKGRLRMGLLPDSQEKMTGATRGYADRLQSDYPARHERSSHLELHIDADGCLQCSVEAAAPKAEEPADMLEIYRETQCASLRLFRSARAWLGPF